MDAKRVMKVNVKDSRRARWRFQAPAVDRDDDPAMSIKEVDSDSTDGPTFFLLNSPGSKMH